MPIRWPQIRRHPSCTEENFFSYILSWYFNKSISFQFLLPNRWRRVNPLRAGRAHTRRSGLTSRSDPSHTASMARATAHPGTLSSRGGSGWLPTTCTPWKRSSSRPSATVSSGSRASSPTTSTTCEDGHIGGMTAFSGDCRELRSWW